MTDRELKAIDDLVVGLRKMGQAIYLTCDAKVASDVCLKTSQACKLINRLKQENACLEKDFNLCYDELETTINDNIAQKEYIIKLEAQLVALK